MVYEINTFFDYWKKRQEFINNLDLHKNRHEAYVLLLSHLDGLSNIWVEKIGKDKCRDFSRRKGLIFDAFLSDYGGNLFQLVSLPHVWNRVQNNNQNNDLNKILPEEVREFLKNFRRQPVSGLSSKDKAVRRNIYEDLCLEDIGNTILKKYPHVDKEKLWYWMRYSRYGKILYNQLRCMFIHQGRPGKNTHDFSFSAYEHEPTYGGHIYQVPNPIGFSAEFLKTILERCIDKYQEESLILRVDPLPDT
ncbi:MAG: hypothetical protein F6K21_11700 [Symploca sp. SIO2D2]|nr:hypothetical protein [Symploca sp. SIO2D2]